MELSISSRVWKDWTVVDIAGELDLNTAPALREHVDGVVAAGSSRVAIGMSDLSFMDSTGLGMMIALSKELAERGGTLALVGVEGSPRKVVAITGVDERIPIVDRFEDLPSE